MDHHENNSKDFDGSGTDPEQNSADRGDGKPPAPHELLAAHVHEALRAVFDPEIPVNIVEIGLIYGVESDPVGNITVKMTLTTPNCPAAQTLPIDVENAAKAIEGVQSVKVDLVWDPPWNPSMMSEAAKLQLNLPYF